MKKTYFLALRPVNVWAWLDVCRNLKYFTYYNVKIIYIKHSSAHHENIKLLRENTIFFLYKYTGGQLHLSVTSSVTQLDYLHSMRMCEVNFLLLRSRNLQNEDVFISIA